MGQFTIFLVLITIVCFLLVVVIMVQNPKGGGLSSTLGGSQMMGGFQKTNDFLTKSTWTLATILVALVLLSSISHSARFASDSNLIDESAVPVTAPATTPAPAAGTVPAEGTAPTTTTPATGETQN